MRWFALVSASALIPVTAIAQAPAAAPGPQVWQLDWHQNHCTIATGDTASAGLALWATPGDPELEVYVVGSANVIRGGVRDKVTVRLEPSGEEFAASIGEGPRIGSDRRRLRLYDLPASFAPAFAAASELRLIGFKDPVSIPVRGAGEAMAAIRQCTDTALSKWGVDPTAYHALRAPPSAVEGYEWIGPDDYPHVALSGGDSGDVVARINVDTSGKVTNCAIVESSGSRNLDQITCARAVQRAKFHPAVGADGHPTAAVRTIHVTFEIM